MKKITRNIILGSISLVLLASCNSVKNANNTQKGAAIGTAAGAILGAVIGNNTGKKGDGGGTGAVIGGVLGGVAGGIIGRKMDKQAERIEEEIPGAEVERVGESINVIFDESSGIYFDSNKATLKPESKVTLDRLEKILEDYPDTNISVTGHTDSSGADDYNMELSKKRAQAVAEYLYTHGLEPSRFTIKWFGETQPKYDNETAEGRKKNRRVELGIVANEKMKEEAIEQANKQ